MRCKMLAGLGVMLTLMLVTRPAYSGSPKSQHWEHAAWRSETPPVSVTSSSRPLALASGPLRRMVYGYLPYWEMPYQVPHWELLEVLAWFGVGIDETGAVVDDNGWGSADIQALVDDAHANDTLVVVTVTLFDDDKIAALLSDPDARTQTIATCLELIARHDVDGVNIDFEFVPGSVKAEFVTFMADLKAAVGEVAPNGGQGHVTLAGPAVDWTGGFDYDGLLAVSDGIMIMGYGYHYGGGPPGPNAPLYGGGIWGIHSVAWTIDDYLTFGGDAFRERIFFGLPWYGRQWPVATTQVPGEALDKGTAIWFDVALEEAAQYGASYDADSHTPYYHKEKDGKLWQVWFDDPESFGEKLAYIEAQDLGGIGLWALGYEGQAEGYWEQIALHLSAAAPDGGDEDSVEGDDAAVDAASSSPSDLSSARSDDAERAAADLELGPEPEQEVFERVRGEVHVSAVGQTTALETRSSAGCGGARGPFSTNWWALFVGLIAIAVFRSERAG